MSTKPAAREVREAGGVAEFLRTDVAEAADVNAMVEHALSAFGGLDAAFNNAGIEGDQAPLPEQDMAHVQRVFDIMINGVYLAMQVEIPALRARGGGAIVNMSSMWGLAGHPEWSPYITAKHAVSGMTKSAALEVAAENIRINAVAPGPFLTPLLGVGSSLGRDRTAILIVTRSFYKRQPEPAVLAGGRTGPPL